MSAEAAIEALANRFEATDELNPGPPSAEKEARKRKIVEAIRRTGIELEVFERDFEALAAKDGITVEAARARHRHIELNPVDEKTPYQLTLYDDSVGVCIAYWHSGEKARREWSELWRILGAIQQVTGYAIYDSQLGRELDLEQDFDKVVGDFSGTSARLPEMLGLKRKPWWMFWRRG
jgi:hypothetical protein